MKKCNLFTSFFPSLFFHKKFVTITMHVIMHMKEICQHPEEYYDCNNNCLNDVDNDNVCDELEILGCTDGTIRWNTNGM